MKKRKRRQHEPDPSDSYNDHDEKLAQHNEYEEATNALYTEEIDVFTVGDGFLPEELAKVANRTYFTVVIYDIVDDARRVKLAKLLLGYGNRVQYSGFEGHLTHKQLDTMTERVRQLIDHDVDKVRIYKIAGAPQVTIFGAVPITDKEEFTII